MQKKVKMRKSFHNDNYMSCMDLFSEEVTNTETESVHESHDFPDLFDLNSNLSMSIIIEPDNLIIKCSSLRLITIL